MLMNDYFFPEHRPTGTRNIKLNWSCWKRAP